MRLRGHPEAWKWTGRRVAWIAALSGVAIAIGCSSGGSESGTPTTAPQQPGQAIGPVATRPPATPVPVPNAPSFPAPSNLGGGVLDAANRGHTVSGFIVDAGSGLPLRGVFVQAKPDGPSAVSDLIGFYRIDGLSSGRHDLALSGYRVEPATASIETETWTRLDIPVSISDGPTRREVFDIAGLIVDRDSGAPVPGATISAARLSAPALERTGAGDEAGGYVLPALPPGRYELSVSAAGYPDYSDQVELGSDIAWDVFLRAPADSVRGRVTGEGASLDRPPFNGSVRAVRLDAAGSPMSALRATGLGQSGEYALEGLAPGRYRIEAVAPGYRPVERAVTLSSGQSVEFNFALELEASSIEISLSSPTYGGMPVANTTVRVQGIAGTPSQGVLVEGNTATDGAVSFSGLPAGGYDVWTPSPSIVSAEGKAELYPFQRAIQLGPGEARTLNEDLPAIPGDLHGFVRAGDVPGRTRLGTSQRDAAASSTADSFDAFPYISKQLPGAKVLVTSARFAGNAFTPPVQSTIADSQGNYVLPLPPGVYNIEVTAPGHVTERSEVALGSSPNALDIRLSPAVTAVVGRIDGAMIQDRTHLTDGSPTEAVFAVAGANVALQRDGTIFTAVTDERGVFAIEGLPLAVEAGSTKATEYQITVSHPDFLLLSSSLSLTAAEGAHRVVRQMPVLAAGGFLEISLTVTDENGSESAAIGRLEGLQNLRTMDTYNAALLAGADTIEIPNLLSLRAQPGQYRARICPDIPGAAGCFDYFWTSSGGVIDTLEMAFTCGNNTSVVRCKLDGGTTAVPDGHIQVSGYVYSASTGKPLPGASVTVSLDVLTEYCGASCTGFIRNFSATGPTGPNGRYELTFQVPATNGGDDLASWSWAAEDQSISVTAAGYQSVFEIGAGAALRSFDSNTNFYLAPSGRLIGLIVSAQADGMPVAGFDPGLGVPVIAGPNRADVTLFPNGADLSTGSEGSVSFGAPPGETTVIIRAPGLYPYSGEVLMPVSTGPEAADARFTIPVEQIPPASITADSFAVEHVVDGQPLKGFVLRGLSGAATKARWEVRVDRNGVRALRTGFIDPVQSVDLFVSVAEGCGSGPGRGGAIHLKGSLLTGSEAGVGTWGGVVDVADLPCGALSWRVEARTSRSIATGNFEWALWPSEQTYPLSLLTGVASPVVAGSALVPVLADGSAARTGLTLSSKSETVRITRSGDFLSYAVQNVVATTGFALPGEGPLLGDLGRSGSAISSLAAGPMTATMDGETGRLDFDSSGGSTQQTGEAVYEIRATALFSLESAASLRPAESAGSWTEAVSSATSGTRHATATANVLPFPLRSPLSNLGVGAVTGDVTEKSNADSSWSLVRSSNSSTSAPVPGQRTVEAGSRLDIVSETEFELGTSVMRHLTVTGGFNARSTTTLEAGGVGELVDSGTIATGNVRSETGLWGVWSLRRQMDAYVFFDRDSGTGTASRSTAVTGDASWTAVPGGFSRPSASAGRAANGEIVVPFVARAPGADGPGDNAVALLRVAPGTTAISDAVPLAAPTTGMAIDTGVAVAPDGRSMLVWSAVPPADDDPGAFVYSATRADIYFSILDPAAGSWSEPKAVDIDNRPDFAPTIVSDGDGRFVLAWARDMDGNVLTVDDIVVFASEWVSDRWSAASPVMPAPRAASEVSVSAVPGTAVVGVATTGPDGLRSVAVSFSSLGRWSPINIVAGDRAGVTEVAVLMDRPGLAIVAWNESGPAGSRVASVEATSAGVRGELTVSDDVVGFVDLALTPAPDGHRLTWVADAGESVYGARRGIDGWTSPVKSGFTHGRSSRFVAVPGPSRDSVLTVHEAVASGAAELVLVEIRIP